MYMVKKCFFERKINFFKRILQSRCVKELNCASAINSLLKLSIRLLGSFANWVFTLATFAVIEKAGENPLKFNSFFIKKELEWCKKVFKKLSISLN